jgi:hypothetical protein
VGDSYVKITNTLNVGMEWMKTVRVLQMDGCVNFDLLLLMEKRSFSSNKLLSCILFPLFLTPA